MARGQGVLLLTPHLGAFEVCAQVCAMHRPITVLYRPHRRADVQVLLEHHRGRKNLTLAPTNLKGVKILLKALRAGQAVGLLPDQVPSAGEGVWAAMFGQDAYTMTLPGSLVHSTGAALVVAVGLRLPRGQGFVVEFSPGPSALGDTPEAAAQAINQAMEGVIAQHPEQYYWGYERYRDPKGG
jgi:KDO2-lipid IV(A) lauroyltransferase